MSPHFPLPPLPLAVAASAQPSFTNSMSGNPQYNSRWTGESRHPILRNQSSGSRSRSPSYETNRAHIGATGPRTLLHSYTTHSQDGRSVHGEKPLPPQPKDPNDRGVLYRWKWEVPSCILSVLSLIAITVILYAYNGRPLPKWPYKITINALISVLTTVLKASMLVVVTEGKLFVFSLRPQHFRRHIPSPRSGTIVTPLSPYLASTQRR